MIVEYIRYQVPDDETDPFEAAYQSAAASLEASPHCQRYEIARCTDDPGAYIVRIEWDSAEGHLQGFRRSPEFQSFFAAVRPYVDMIEEMRHYASRPAARLDRAGVLCSPRARPSGRGVSAVAPDPVNACALTATQSAAGADIGTVGTQVGSDTRTVTLTTLSLLPAPAALADRAFDIKAVC